MEPSDWSLVTRLDQKIRFNIPIATSPSETRHRYSRAKIKKRDVVQAFRARVTLALIFFAFRLPLASDRSSTQSLGLQSIDNRHRHRRFGLLARWLACLQYSVLRGVWLVFGIEYT